MVQDNARKEKLGRVETLKLLKSVRIVHAAKGKQVVQFALPAKGPPGNDVLAAIIGPSGNLRAPALRVGKVLVVGFNAGMYGEVLEV